MNTAMHIMSIQHQLVLAIGEGYDLEEMLHQFLLICSSRLDATNSHVFLFQNNDNKPIHQQSDQQHAHLKHYLSLPKQKHGSLWSENVQLTTQVEQFHQTNCTTANMEKSTSVCHFFKIGFFGVLVLERKKLLGETIQNALLPVLQKLATSCIASMVHQTLLEEVKTRKKVEQRIRYQASHDYLTGLCNRIEMERCLSKALVDCQNNNLSGGLLLIDLVHFKNINDVLGHHVGDKVLRQVADRLKSVTNEAHTIARFGGDEFILLLADMPSNKKNMQLTIDTLAKRIIAIIERPIEILEGTFSISCFIGYETFENNRKTTLDIIKNAGIATYEAVKRGRSQSVAYESCMSERLNQRINYTREIEEALTNNEFELHYQPQYDHCSNMIGAEALLRWNHPLRGYESPALYIPIAEESDLIVRIGDFVLRQACSDIQAIEHTNLPDSFKQISVNVSAKQLARTDFVSTVLQATTESGINPSRLKLEITESIMMGDIELSISYLEELRKKGIECAIDDFGTGYSSLAYLKRLPASLLKIDRAFVTDIHCDEGNNAIANMIIELAKRLKMDVIAEGVENKQELECLIALGCYQYQGYYFSRPLPFGKLINAINKKIELEDKNNILNTSNS